MKKKVLSVENCDFHLILGYTIDFQFTSADLNIRVDFLKYWFSLEMVFQF